MLCQSGMLRVIESQVKSTDATITDFANVKYGSYEFDGHSGNDEDAWEA